MQLGDNEVSASSFEGPGRSARSPNSSGPTGAGGNGTGTDRSAVAPTLGNTAMAHSTGRSADSADSDRCRAPP